MEMIQEAKQIARHGVGAPPTTTGAVAGEFLTFRLGAEEYGIEILKVQEIRSYEPPTRIANVPDFIKGVVNLRGFILPIVDLRLNPLTSQTKPPLRRGLRRAFAAPWSSRQASSLAQRPLRSKQ